MIQTVRHRHRLLLGLTGTLAILLGLYGCGSHEEPKPKTARPSAQEMLGQNNNTPPERHGAPPPPGAGG